VIEQWRVVYNTLRPHSALGCRIKGFGLVQQPPQDWQCEISILAREENACFARPVSVWFNPYRAKKKIPANSQPDFQP
jgi:hypothetical protein